MCEQLSIFYVTLYLVCACKPIRRMDTPCGVYCMLCGTISLHELMLHVYSATESDVIHFNMFVSLRFLTCQSNAAVDTDSAVFGRIYAFWLHIYSLFSPHRRQTKKNMKRKSLQFVSVWIFTIFFCSSNTQRHYIVHSCTSTSPISISAEHFSRNNRKKTLRISCVIHSLTSAHSHCKAMAIWYVHKVNFDLKEMWSWRRTVGDARM